MYSCKERKEYIKKFNKRFKITSSLHETQEEEQFSFNLIESIKSEYRKEISRNSDSNKYIENEKIRLNIKIKEQDVTGISLHYLNNIFSTITSGMIFGVGAFMPIYFNGIKSMVDTVTNNGEKSEQIRNIILDNVLFLGKTIYLVVIILLLSSIIYNVYIGFSAHKFKVKKIIDKKFDIYCLEALQLIGKDLS
ncbi:hypothetical protein ACQPU1_13905 [Clostridium paraputrificum]|uniref:hypothetical protein n=1 Tax=Clostridium paraputrificum TaxID=29363 RepID=UPI003D357DB1